MSEQPEYIYIMYPIPIDEAKNLPFFNKPPQLPSYLQDDNEDFMPLWFGNAKFPEDDIDD
ncbi:MAG: hypothetical protein IKU60_01125 [Clostridia bacterium]|nr:hypothetical protein [Clostridia bacterium]